MTLKYALQGMGLLLGSFCLLAAGPASAQNEWPRT